MIVDFYREVGYLPDAILNYLVLLGWSLDDKTEDFTREQMIELFSLERVNKAPASFDAKKLWAFQERRMQALPVAEKVRSRVCRILERVGARRLIRKCLARVVTEAGPRLVVAGDILDYDFFFIPDDQLAYDEKAVEKHCAGRRAPRCCRSCGRSWRPRSRSTRRR